MVVHAHREQRAASVLSFFLGLLFGPEMVSVD